MNRNYNQMIFTKKEQANSFIETLLNYNNETASSGDTGETYNDIHIYQDDTFIVVEWTQVPYDDSYGGRFKFVDEDQQVMLKVELPDNSISWAFDEDDKREMIDYWCKEHPTWKQNSYGVWYEESDYEDLRKELIKNEKDN